MSDWSFTMKPKIKAPEGGFPENVELDEENKHPDDEIRIPPTFSDLDIDKMNEEAMDSESVLDDEMPDMESELDSHEIGPEDVYSEEPRIEVTTEDIMAGGGLSIEIEGVREGNVVKKLEIKHVEWVPLKRSLNNLFGEYLKWRDVHRRS